MSDYGVFEADHDAQQEPQRVAHRANIRLANAVGEVRHHFGPFLLSATGLDDFEDRWNYSRHDIRKSVNQHVPPVTGVMNRVKNALKHDFKMRSADINEEHDGPTEPAKDDGDQDRTINDRQLKKIHDGDKTVGDEVETNSGDGSDAEGLRDDDEADDDHGKPDEHGDKKESRRRYAEDRSAPFQDLPQGREHDEGLLIPDAYNDPSTTETHKVQNDFGRGGDTGVDGHHEARRLLADLYTDWAQTNGLRVASMNTLDVYAANGMPDEDYFLLAGLVRQAECDCDDDDHDSDSPPPPKKESSDSDSDSDDDSDDSDSDEGGSDDESDSDSDAPSDSEDSDDDSGDSDSGDNPFASDEGPEDDAGEPADDGGNPFAGPEDAGPPAPEDAGPPPGPEDAGPPPPEAGPPDDVGGQSFEVPQEAPDLPPEMQGDIPPDDTQGDAPIPPEVVDAILGLPPGTVEQLIMEELQGGNDPIPVMAHYRRMAMKRIAARRHRIAGPFDEDPTQAAEADPAAAAQPQDPAAPAASPPMAPPAGSGSAGTMAPPGSASVPPSPPPMPLENQPAEDALLDTAAQSVTQMIDQETQEYQQIIDPLTQALQAIQFAQQVEGAENPLDVTPPQGTVDVNPSAAPGGADSQQEKAAALQQHALRLAQHYNLTENGYHQLLTAMSRKHYQHVAEAIQTLPPEHRGGIAASMGDMFAESNPRFNHDQFYQAAGVDPRFASRLGFTRGSGQTKGWTPTQTIDSFEFAGQGETPQIDDNIAVDNLPKSKPLPGQKKPTASLDREAKDVLHLWDTWNKGRSEKGLNMGGEPDFDSFANETKVGPKALQKLKTTVSPASPAVKNQTAPTVPTQTRSASFFTRRVPGWVWDDHLNGYVTKSARNFTCSCGEPLPTPSYTNCKCGKTWNSYAIGDNTHLASDTADMYIAREIPVREGVIVASKKTAWTSDSGWTPPGSEVEWVEDEDREDIDDEDAPHAPGKTAGWSEHPEGGWNHSDGGQLRPSTEKPDHWQLYGPTVSRHPEGGPLAPLHRPSPDPQSAMDWYNWTSGEGPRPADHPGLIDKAKGWLNRPAFFKGAPFAGYDDFDDCESKNQDKGDTGAYCGEIKHRTEDKQGARDFFADWTKYDGDDPSEKVHGKAKIPSTTVKGGDPVWHTRQQDGQFGTNKLFG